MPPQISVVIPTTQGRQEFLRTLLNSINSAEVLGLDLEVVVVSDCAIDLGWTFPRDANFRVRWLCHRKPGAALARNAGIRHANGDIVCFLDDDVLVHRKFFSNLARSFAKESPAALLGRVWIAPRNAHGLSPDKLWVMAEDGRFADGGWSGANLSVARRVLIQLGGFDERLGRHSYDEDLDLIWRLKRVGLQLAYSRDCSVIHFKAIGGGIEGRGMGSWEYVYFSAKNDIYVLLKNGILPLGFFRGARKSARRISQTLVSRRIGATGLFSLWAAYLRASLEAFMMYLKALNEHATITSRKSLLSEHLVESSEVNTPKE